MNHIKVELDFIPVEERLPDNTREVFITEKYTSSFGKGFLTNSRIWIGRDAEGDDIVNNYVTHWAEIPRL